MNKAQSITVAVTIQTAWDWTFHSCMPLFKKIDGHEMLYVQNTLVHNLVLTDHPNLVFPIRVSPGFSTALRKACLND